MKQSRIKVTDQYQPASLVLLPSSSALHQAPPGRPPGGEPGGGHHSGLRGVGRRPSSHSDVDEAGRRRAPEEERLQWRHADRPHRHSGRRRRLQLHGVQQRGQSCQENDQHPGQRYDTGLTLLLTSWGGRRATTRCVEIFYIYLMMSLRLFWPQKVQNTNKINSLTENMIKDYTSKLLLCFTELHTHNWNNWLKG